MTEAEEVQSCIDKAQLKITRGWKCGETCMPLTEGHIAQLSADVNIEAQKIREKHAKGVL